MKSAIRFTVLFAAACGMLAASGAFAQAFPSKPVRLVVPYPAGGVADVMSRIIAERISANWGQSVIVDPRPGGDGIIGTETVLNAPADGYTWLGVSSGHAAIGAGCRCAGCQRAAYPTWEGQREYRKVRHH